MRPRQAPAPGVERRAFTLSEAAQVLNLGTNSLRTLIRSGRLHAIRVGTRLIVPVAAVERFLADGGEHNEEGA